MADTSRIKSNLQKMIDQGASEEELDRYVQSEGTTPEELRGESLVSRGYDTAKEVVESISNAVVGTQDPKYADVPPFVGQGMGMEFMSDMAKAKMVAISDEAYADIIRKKLGGKLLSMKMDANGYRVLTYKDRDGTKRTAYVNKPGLDMQDVDRVVSASIPYAATAAMGASGAAALGVGTLAKMGIQGVAAAGTSVGADVAAGNMGSEQGISLGQAGLAAAGAGIFEGLSKPVVAAWRSIFNKGGVSETGKLTGRAAEEARSLGLDPEDMQERLSQQFAKDIGTAADPEEVAAKTRMGEFGIESSVGQRTKDPKQLGLEEEMRRGQFGSRAQAEMQGLDKRQGGQISDAVEGVVGGGIAPRAVGREPATTGGRIAEGVRAQKAIAEDAENQIWSQVGLIEATPEAMNMMPGALYGSVSKAGIAPHPELTKASHQMLTTLDKFRRGEPLGESYQVLGEMGEGVTSVDQMRRILLGQYKSAEPKSPDARLAKSIYDGYNNWIDDIAEARAIQGDIGAAAQLSNARAFTKDLKALYEPKNKRGRQTPGGKILDQIMENETNPEGVITSLFGRQGPTGPAATGTVEAVTRLKSILQKKAPEIWDDVRLAYWTKLTTDNQGRVLTGKNLTNNINRALANQGSVMNKLYSSQEMSMMRRLGAAVEDTTFTPPNPSGTSYELMRMLERSKGGLPKTYAQVQHKRELFSKNNVLMARLWQGIAKKLPFDPMGFKEQTGAKVARQATSQSVRPKGGPSLSPVGGSLGAQYSNRQ